MNLIQARSEPAVGCGTVRSPTREGTLELRSIGDTGVSVSALGFGCGAFAGLLVRGERDGQVRAVQRAIEGGITYFDTAAQYGDGLSEESLGRALAAIGATNEVTIGTKVRLEPDELASPEPVIRASLEASLKRLQRDMVDVFVFHNFPRESEGRNGFLLEQLPAVYEAMSALKREGLTRSIGLTCVGETPAILRAIETNLFDVAQVYFNVLNPSAVHPGANGGGQDFEGAASVARKLGQTSMGVRTVAGGALVASNYRSEVAGPVGDGGGLGGNPYANDLERAQRLIPLARDAGCKDVMEFGLRFAISEPPIASSLIGFSDLEQVEKAIRSASRGPLPKEAIEAALEVARS